MKTQTIVKINKVNSISIVNLEELEIIEIAHIRNNEVCYDVVNEVITLDDSSLKYKINEEVEKLAACILLDILVDEKYEVTFADEAMLNIANFVYEIYVSPSYQGKKIVWELSTVREETKDEDEFEKNKVSRSTWKGLINYLKRFEI